MTASGFHLGVSQSEEHENRIGDSTRDTINNSFVGKGSSLLATNGTKHPEPRCIFAAILDKAILTPYTDSNWTTDDPPEAWTTIL